MSEMVERAARAACVALGMNPDDLHNGRETHWQTEVPPIRAALMAALDPFDAALNERICERTNHPARDIQRIIAALREECAQGEQP